MTPVDWWFDFISPYAYLQSERLDAFDGLADVRLRPVLFAALLEHYGQKGPAEIGPKRVHTYRQVVWIAHREGIALTLPPAHPFNPLPLLRLFTAAGGTRTALRRIFRFVWAEGCLPTQSDALMKLAASVGINDPEEALARPEIKQVLRSSTEDAIARGVFGVPTISIGNAHYWGFDSTDMALADLRGDAFLHGDTMRRAGELPVGAQRRPGPTAR